MDQEDMPQVRDGLRFGPLGDRCLHLCVDMQNLFSKGSPWETPWMERVLPAVEALAERHAERSIFTRFIPLRSPREGRGTWRRYYERWSEMRLDALPPGAIDLLPPLMRFVPPGELLDKTVYSPWSEPDLEERLRARGVDTLVITGAETDVCVLAAVLGAVDRGYRVVLPTDALCSSSDRTHDALLALYRERYGQQVETVRMAEILSAWD